MSSTAALSADGLDLKWHQALDVTIFCAGGELDLVTAPAFLAAAEVLLQKPEPTPVVLDLSRVEFCDLAGLRAVLHVQAMVRNRGRSMQLCQSFSIERVATAAGLADMLLKVEEQPWRPCPA